MNLLSKVTAFLNSGSERSKIVKRNAVGAMLIKAGSMAIDFAKVPVLLTYLNAELYGVFITITSIVYWTQQFDFGLGAGLRYQLTRSISLGDKERSKKLISSAYLSLLMIMALVFVIGLPFIYMLDWKAILNTEIVRQGELLWCLVFVFGSMLVQFVLEIISVVLQADQKAAISTIFKPLANLITIIVVLIIGLCSHESLLFASFATVLPLMAVLLLSNIYLFKGRYKEISPSPAFFRREVLKDIYSMGLKYFIGQFSALIVFQTSSFLISHYVNPTEAAVYNTAFVYFGVLMYFNNMVLSPLTAAITDAAAKNDINWIRDCMKKISMYSVALTFMSLLLLAFSKVFFHLWVGNRLDIPWELSVLMSIYFIMNIWVTPYINFVAGVGKMNLFCILSIVKIIIFIPVAILLIQQMGTMGMIFSIILVNTLPNIVFLPYQSYLIIKNKAYGIWKK